MQQLLVALDGTPGSLKTIPYLTRTLRGNDQIRLWLFHVLATASPNLLKREEIQRIEQIQEEQPHLSGYFWTLQDQNKMTRTFQQATTMLLQGGFSEPQIRTWFGVESNEIARVILEQAQALGCDTIVLGRRGLSRVKEFFLGSVSKSVLAQARGLTIWVVDA